MTWGSLSVPGTAHLCVSLHQGNQLPIPPHYPPSHGCPKTSWRHSFNIMISKKLVLILLAWLRYLFPLPLTYPTISVTLYYDYLFTHLSSPMRDWEDHKGRDYSSFIKSSPVPHLQCVLTKYWLGGWMDVWMGQQTEGKERERGGKEGREGRWVSTWHRSTCSINTCWVKEKRERGRKTAWIRATVYGGRTR